MTAIVVDNSVLLSWCMGDEEEPAADEAMRRVIADGGVVPRIWWYELRNALLMNERHGRISPQQVMDTKLAAAVEAYFADPGRVGASDGETAMPASGPMRRSDRGRTGRATAGSHACDREVVVE